MCHVPMCTCIIHDYLSRKMEEMFVELDDTLFVSFLATNGPDHQKQYSKYGVESMALCLETGSMFVYNS